MAPVPGLLDTCTRGSWFRWSLAAVWQLGLGVPIAPAPGKIDNCPIPAPLKKGGSGEVRPVVQGLRALFFALLDSNLALG